MKLKSRFFKIMGKFDQLREYIWPAILVLGIIVFLTFLWAIVVLIFPSFLPESNGLSVLPAISISAGVLIAIVTFFGDRERNSSKFFLERAIGGFDEVVHLLSNKNNNRMVWLHAARTLLQSCDLGAQIKSPEYKKVFQLQVDITRAKLNQVLSLENAKTGDTSPLPPQFFYGHPSWQDDISLDELAKKVSDKVKVYSPDINLLPPQINFRPISEKSIVAIYNFLEFPKDYLDPLGSIEVWSADWMSTLGRDEQGARQYISHRKYFYATDGKLFDAKTGEEVN